MYLKRRPEYHRYGPQHRDTINVPKMAILLVLGNISGMRRVEHAQQTARLPGALPSAITRSMPPQCKVRFETTVSRIERCSGKTKEPHCPPYMSTSWHGPQHPTDDIPPTTLSSLHAFWTALFVVTRDLTRSARLSPQTFRFPHHRLCLSRASPSRTKLLSTQQLSISRSANQARTQQ